MLSTSGLAERARAPRVTVVPVTHWQEWEALFACVSLPHFTQSWCYGEAKRRQGWAVERFALHDGGMPMAICQVLVKKLAGIPCVARINRGPLFLASSDDVQRDVLRALYQRWRFARRGLLLIAPALPDDDASSALLRTAGFTRRKPRGWGSALIDLQPSPDEIRAGVSREWRKNLGAALKAGVTLRIHCDPQGYDWMLRKHAEHMESRRFAGPGSDFVRAMIDASPGDFRVFQALSGGEVCSGLLVARFGDHAESYLSWTDDTGRRLNAHTFLMWHAFLEMKRLGCRAMDLGGYSTTEKYGAYKRSMRGREYRLAGEWLAF